MPEVTDIRRPGLTFLNLDIDPKSLPEQFHIAARNVHSGVGEEDTIGALEDVYGTEKYDIENLTGELFCIGWCPDNENNRLIFFIYGFQEKNHSIISFNPTTNKTVFILNDPVLNFSKDHRVAHAQVVDGILYWTDNYNPPRKLNIEKAINYTANEAVTSKDRYFAVTTYSAERMREILQQAKRPPYKGPEKLDGSILVDGQTYDAEQGYIDDESFFQNNLRGYLWRFKYRYIFDDNERSVFSPDSPVFFDNKSQLSNGSYVEEQYVANAIALSIMTGPEEVRAIEIIASSGSNWKIIDRIEKYGLDDQVLVASNVELNRLFYNKTVGEAIDQKNVAVSHYQVPLLAKTMSLIEGNRLVYGNTLEGYDYVHPDIELSPKYEKVVFEDQVDLNVFVLSSNRYRLALYEGQFQHNAVYSFYIQIPGTDVEFVTSVVAYPSMSREDTWTALFYAVLEMDGATSGSYTLTVAASPGLTIEGFIVQITTNPSAALTVGSTGFFPSETYQHFKTGAYHAFGLRYYDDPLRPNSVCTIDAGTVYVPTYPALKKNGTITFEEPIHRCTIDWQIKHIPPSWAKYCQWVRKPVYPYFLNWYVPGENIERKQNFVWIEVNSLIQDFSNRYEKSTVEQYIWQKGDRLRLYAYKTPSGFINYWGREIDREILAVTWSDDLTQYGYQKDDAGDYITDADGNKIREPARQKLLLDDFDLESSGIKDDPGYYYYIEIYRPGKEQADEQNEIWFEFGEVMPIINPGLSTRRHSKGYDDGSSWARDQTEALSARGTFVRGNVYIKNRNDGIQSWPVESKWFSDFYSSEQNDNGRPAIFSREFRQKRYETLLRYGGLYIQESNINDLTALLGGDVEVLNVKYGPINVLRELGFTLKVRQSYKVTSIYVGRAGLKQAAIREEGLDVVVKSDKILGTQYEIEQRYGSINPESEVIVGRHAYFVDQINGHICREARNGIISISEFYNVDSWVKETCEYLYEQCNDVRILGAFNGKYNEVLFTFYGRDKDTNEIFAETIMFHDPEGKTPGWKANMDFRDKEGIAPDCYGYIGQELVGVRSGEIHVHDRDSDNRANFYGAQYYGSISLVFNKANDHDKVFRVLEIDSDNKWSAETAGDIAVPESPNRSEQVSKMPKERLQAVHGFYYGPFGKNMVSKSSVPTIKDFVTGNDLRGALIIVKLTTTTKSGSLLRYVKVKSNVSQLTGN